LELGDGDVDCGGTQRPVVTNDQRQVAVNHLTARSYHLKVLARPVTPAITRGINAVIVKSTDNRRSKFALHYYGGAVNAGAKNVGLKMRIWKLQDWKM